MSIPYETTGRTHQKSRTRAALLAAVHDLLRTGRTPTVEDAAGAARISRTTAYRYFPNQHELLAAAHPEIDATSLLGADPPVDPEARLDLVLADIEQQILKNEPELRTALRLSLDPGTARARLLVRQGRAITWLTDALRPLREEMSDRELHHLVLAIRATVGIEAFAWLTDVGGLSRRQALALMHRSAKTLFAAALRDLHQAPVAVERATTRGDSTKEATRPRRPARRRRVRWQSDMFVEWSGAVSALTADARASPIEKLLEKDRGLRYQTAADLRADLQRLTRNVHSAPEPPTKRNRIALLAAAIVMVLAAAAAGRWFRSSAR